MHFPAKALAREVKNLTFKVDYLREFNFFQKMFFWRLVRTPKVVF